MSANPGAAAGPVMTSDDRRYLVNVEVFLHRSDGRWLLIRRGPGERVAAGLLAGVGGKADLTPPADEPLERTARREVAEEVGVDLTGVPLRYVASSMFAAAPDRPVINVVFAAELPAGVQPVPVSPSEVAEIVWLTTEEAAHHPDCPAWMRESLAAAVPYGIRPVGYVHSTLVDPEAAPRQGSEHAPDAWLVFLPDVAEAVRDLAADDEIYLLTWLHRAPRDVLVVHPRGDPRSPRTGVFSTRSQSRPNPVGLHRVRVRATEGLRVRVSELEAVHGTPVVDVKPVLEGGR